MDKIKTGIKGFDKLVDGGFPKGGNVLLSGTPGTGKTIFGLQFLYNGATLFNEKGLYITFEEKTDNIKKQAKQFGWDFDDLKKKNKVRILEISPKHIKYSTVEDILKIIKQEGYARLVIDSLSALAINTPMAFNSAIDITELSVKRFIYHFINDLRNEMITTLLISQTTENQLSRDGVSEFICDGVIYVKYEHLGGNFSRYLVIRKMRQTKNDENIHPVEITNSGLVIHTLK